MGKGITMGWEKELLWYYHSDGQVSLQGQSLAPSKIKLLTQKLIQPAEGNDACICHDMVHILPPGSQMATATREVRNTQTFAQCSLKCNKAKTFTWIGFSSEACLSRRLPSTLLIVPAWPPITSIVPPSFLVQSRCIFLASKTLEGAIFPTTGQIHLLHSFLSGKYVQKEHSNWTSPCSLLEKEHFNRSLL